MKLKTDQHREARVERRSSGKHVFRSVCVLGVSWGGADVAGEGGTRSGRDEHRTRMTLWSQAMTQRLANHKRPRKGLNMNKKKNKSERNTELENHITRKWLKPSRCVLCFPTFFARLWKRSGTSTGAVIKVQLQIHTICM